METHSQCCYCTILLAQRVVKAFTTRNELGPFLDDKEQLAEDLLELSRWIAKDGFIPFVDLQNESLNS